MLLGTFDQKGIVYTIHARNYVLPNFCRLLGISTEYKCLLVTFLQEIDYYWSTMKHGKHSLTTTIRNDVFLKGRSFLKLENSHVVDK